MKYLTVLILMVIFTNQCVNNKTPSEYEYVNSFIEKEYKSDSIKLVDYVEELVKKNNSAFYSKKYNADTQIFIDTILYSPDKDFLVCFVITRTINSRLLVTDLPNEYHYDGSYFTGVKNQHEWDIKWLSLLNFNRFTSYNELSQELKYGYFTRLKKLGGFKYNANDTRFWNSLKTHSIKNKIEQHVSPNNE